MIAVKNILVATDFSECSDAALAYGRALAGQFGARLHILHSVEFIGAADVAGVGAYSMMSPDLVDRLESDARDRINELVSPSDRDVLNVKTTVTVAGPTAGAIVDYAKAESIDLIVLGTHGRRGLSHFLLGSVAEHVVREAPCPVLTVRSPERDFVVARPAAESMPVQQK